MSTSIRRKSFTEKTVKSVRPRDAKSEAASRLESVYDRLRVTNEVGAEDKLVHKLLNVGVSLEIDRTVQLLGGSAVFRHAVLHTDMDVHNALLHGVPYAALLDLVKKLSVIHESDVVNVLGLSLRTLRRQREAPETPMPPALASKTWQFAETVAKATEVFGSKERAEEWMSKPAVGLDGQRPIDLLRTVQGAALVEEFLGRLEYDVYT